MEAARGGSVLCHVRGRRAARGLGLRGHAGRHVSQGGDSGHEQRKLLQWLSLFLEELFMFLFFDLMIKQVVYT